MLFPNHFFKVSWKGSRPFVVITGNWTKGLETLDSSFSCVEFIINTPFNSSYTYYVNRYASLVLN